MTDTSGAATVAPDGYESRIVGKTTLVALRGVADALTEVLMQHGSLYSWARQVPQPRALRGRAPVFVATVPGSDDLTIVVRHAWHGGMLAPLTRDVYRRPSRAPRELRISGLLRAATIATPQIIAYALYDAGPGLVRVDVASRYIPDAYDFAAVLARHAPDIERSDALSALQLLLSAMARNRFVHPDLNVKNVLLQRERERVVASVLDVDVVEHRPDSSPHDVHARNAARFLRSLRKAPLQFGIQIAPDEFVSFDRVMSQVTEQLS
ncbi:MAG: lipopolysaccharide kinase InaA family protein [Gemmatimonas sp.]